MGKAEAQAYYDPIGGETTGYISPQDAKDAIGLIYDDLGTPTSTDNAVVRFNGVLGGIQDSGVLIDDSNNVSVPGQIEGAAPNAQYKTPRLARTPNDLTGDLGLPGYAGSDTGVRSVTGGTIRRCGNVVTRSSLSVTPTAGFSDSESTGALTYLTRDAWPSSLPGAQITIPITWS